MEFSNIQDFNVKKFALDGSIQYLENGLGMVKQMLVAAKTEEDLEKIQIYLNMTISSAQDQIDKIVHATQQRTR